MSNASETDQLVAHPAKAGKGRSVVDWTQVHGRLEAAQAAINRAVAPALEERKKVLRERARRLARPNRRAGAIEEGLEVVEFLLAHERYGIESALVWEVYALKELTPLPGTPSFVLGITSVRGRIVSVIDLKKFFGLPERGLGDLNKLILVGSEEIALGILADAMCGLRVIPFRELQPSLPTLTGIRAEYLRAVTGDRLVVLDVEKIISDPKMVVHEQVD